MTPITQIAEYKRSLKPSLDKLLGGYAGPRLSVPDALGLADKPKNTYGGFCDCHQPITECDCWKPAHKQLKSTKLNFTKR